MIDYLRVQRMEWMRKQIVDRTAINFFWLEIFDHDPERY
jgi:hypothetical protein